MDTIDHPSGLTDAQRASWDDNGYLAVESLLGDDEVLALRDAAERLTARADGLEESTDRFKLQAFSDDGGGRLVQQIAEPHELGAEWMALARDRRILDVVEGLIG